MLEDAALPPVLLCRPHSTSADGLDAKMQGLVCSLKVYIWLNSSACLHHFIPSLGHCFLVSAPERIQLHRVHIFHWFRIMSLKRFSVNCYEEKREAHKETFLLLLMSVYSRYSLPHYHTPIIHYKILMSFEMVTLCEYRVIVSWLTNMKIKCWTLTNHNSLVNFTVPLNV